MLIYYSNVKEYVMNIINKNRKIYRKEQCEKIVNKMKQ